MSAVGRPVWGLRRRMTALSLLVGVVLAFLATGATFAAVTNQDRLDELLDTVGPMRAAANDLRAALTAQEAAVNAYVLNGNAADTARYSAAITAEYDATQSIATSPASTPEIRAQLDRITSSGESWRTAVAEPMIAATVRGDQATAQAMMDEGARARFEAVIADVDSMRTAMQAIRDDAVATIRDTSSTILFVLIVAAIMVIAGGFGLVIALQRTVTDPVMRLAARVRSVARGDYGLEISTEGPPELRALARDVDSMRRQIASDLAIVETARRQIEDANLLLEHQAAELTRSNRDLEQFAYVASHDLQEPLRKVSSFCQLLQRRYAGQLDERADQYIAFAVSGAQRMQRLINDLLAFSRIGRVTTGFTDVDLGRVVAELSAGPDPVSSDPSAITWSDLPTVRGEESLLSTLLGNLVGNALKFGRPGVPPHVHISGRRVDDAWEISCVDNGIGIDEEYAEKVFVIFQRLHARDAYPGTGIGLAVAKKIVEYHGGRIWIDPSHDDGAAIRFTLPVSAPDPTAAPAVSRTIPSASSSPPGPRVPSHGTDRAKEPVA